MNTPRGGPAAAQCRSRKRSQPLVVSKSLLHHIPRKATSFDACGDTSELPKEGGHLVSRPSAI